MTRSQWYVALLLTGVFAMGAPIAAIEAKASTTPIEDLALVNETSDASSVTPEDQLANRERRERRRERRERRRERRERRREHRERRRERREHHREHHHREHHRGHGGLPVIPS